jgi:hypothetical protein
MTALLLRPDDPDAAERLDTIRAALQDRDDGQAFLSQIETAAAVFARSSV